MRYGLPYQGSKNAIARQIVEVLPPGETFVDLFAGGCAITHAAMLSHKYKRFICNDISDVPRLFFDAVSGRYHDETRWISREDFFRLKDTEPYIRYCWSFGNNGEDYLYSKEIEPYKRACHYLVMFRDGKEFARLCPEVAEAVFEALDDIEDTKERRVMLGRAVVRWLKANGNDDMVNNNPLYRSCHTRKDTKTRPKGTIRDIQSLQSLQRLQRLQIYQLDYQQVEIPEGAVVYCDIPYIGTAGDNGTEFDHERFYEWVDTRSYPVFVSEYTMPSDRFAPIYKIGKNALMSNQGVTKKMTECVFTQKRYADRYKYGLFGWED